MAENKNAHNNALPAKSVVALEKFGLALCLVVLVETDTARRRDQCVFHVHC